MTGRSNCRALWISACSRWAISAPMASAVRSTDLVVTSKPARSCSCSRPRFEGGFLPYQSLHAAHPGRKLRIFDVQFDIHRKLTDVTWGTQVVGAGNAHRTYDRQDGFATDFLVLGVMATAARQLTLIGRRGFELQQFS